MNFLHGAHAPDGQMYDIEQLCHVARGSVTILDFLLSDSELAPFGGPLMHADYENCGWYGVLRWGRESQGVPAHPTRRIHVRMYHPDWRKHALDMGNPQPSKWRVRPDMVRGWARYCVDRFSDWHGLGEHHQRRADLFLDPYVVFSPMNEPDIEPRWAAYFQAVLELTMRRWGVRQVVLL